MLTRRHILLSGAGLLAARFLPRRTAPGATESRTGLLVRGGLNARSAVLLRPPPGEWFDLEALDGIGAPFLRPLEDCELLMALDLHRGYGRLELPDNEEQVHVRLPGGPSGLAAAWAVPALGIGNFIGFHMADIASLVRPPFSAEFHHLLDDGAVAWPRSLRRCSGAFLTYFGEGLSLSRLYELAREVEALLPAGADFLFATAERRAWTPRALLTVFD